MNDEQIRKDFEEWVGDGGLSPSAIERNSKGDYILMQAASTWHVWKAAYAHYAKPAAPVVLPEPFGYFKAEPFGWRDCAETDEGAIALYEAPQPQADARDAERWRFIKRKLCLTGNGDGTCAMQALNLPARILGWPDVGELAIAQFLDAAIDAAIAVHKEKTE